METDERLPLCQYKPLSAQLVNSQDENKISHRPKYWDSLTKDISSTFCPLATALYLFHLLDIVQQFSLLRIKDGYLEALRHCCTPKELAEDPTKIPVFTRKGRSTQLSCSACGLYISNTLIDAFRDSRRTQPIKIDPTKIDLEWIRSKCPYLKDHIPTSTSLIPSEIPPPKTLNLPNGGEMINPTFFFAYHKSCKNPSYTNNKITDGGSIDGSVGHMMFGNDPHKASYKKLACYCVINGMPGKVNSYCYYVSDFDPTNRSNWNRGNQMSVPLGAYSMFYFESAIDEQPKRGINNDVNSVSVPQNYIDSWC